MKKKSIKKLTAIFIPVIAVLLALGVTLNVLYGMYESVIAAAFSDTTGVVDDEYKAGAAENAREVNIELEEEGAVLLKNENNTLPVSDSKVNVYGLISANLYLNGSGSSASNSSLEVITLKAALESQGIEVNSSLWSLLESGSVNTSSSNIDEGNTATRTSVEFTLDQYNSAASWTSAKTYSDYAIVTYGRVGGEGSDLSRGEAGTSTDYLAFDDGEMDLIEKLHEEGFKVILLLNTSHVMSLAQIEQYADAILWIGGPGVTGAQAVGEILAGTVSPSGRLVDTWMCDQTTNSTYYTADKYTYVSGSSTIGGYTNFNEGIYVGYKWYETAAAEGFWSTNEAYSRWGVENYEDVVMYPFGYGLSYGDLTEKITGYTYENGTFTFTIKAENLNSVPTKDVIELYVEKPESSVESAKVELVAFAKTDLLATGVSGYESSQTITLTVEADDLSSYDETADSGNGAYVLAGGQYKFYLASGETGAHIWASADSDRCISHNLAKQVYSDSEDGARSSDQTAAKNVFGADSNNNALAIDDDTSGYKALSRANGFANAYGTVFPETQGEEMFGTIELSSGDELYEALVTNASSYIDYQGEIADNLSYSQAQKYTLADLYTTDAEGNPLYTLNDDGTKNVTGSVDYDDERWDYLISQMSLDEMEKLISQAGWMTLAVSSISKEKAADYDGPYGLSNLMKASTGQEQSCMSYCSEVVSASTWNTDLLEKLGQSVAKEANASGQSGWYAPGVNIHRTPYGGRNPEYFSEDALISGYMAAYEVKGAKSGGLYCYAKHFAFNDIEANRTSKENCWMSEQTAREIYLRPFEIAVKEGGLTGIMTSYMWMCGQWMGSNYSLMTEIVRNEWGYNGSINTDNAGTAGITWMKPIQLLNAGGDMVLETIKVSLPSDFKSSDEGISAMKTAVKHILYMTADAYLYREVEATAGSNVILPVYIAANVVIFGGALILAAVYVTMVLRYKRIPKVPDATDTEARLNE